MSSKEYSRAPSRRSSEFELTDMKRSRSKSKSSSKRSSSKSQKSSRRSKSGSRRRSTDGSNKDRRKSRKKDSTRSLNQQEDRDSESKRKKKKKHPISDEENRKDRQNRASDSSRRVKSKKRSKSPKKSRRRKKDDEEDEAGDVSETDNILVRKDSDIQKNGSGATPSSSTCSYFENLSAFSMFSKAAMSCCELRLFQPIARNLKIGLRPMDDNLKFKKPRHGFKDPTVVQVKILRVDELAEDPLIFHPIVRVSIVDGRTGRYFEKEDSVVPAVSHYEQSSIIKGTTSGTYTAKDGEKRHSSVEIIKRKSTSCRRIPCQISEPCDLGDGPVHVVAPSWEKKQPLIFNIPFEHILNPHVIIFFEILDFGASIPYNLVSKGQGFYPIAWAFLRVVNKNGNLNINAEESESSGSSNARLQLYKYPSQGFLTKAYIERDRKGEYGSVPAVFDYYRAMNRVRYPSTIYVNISGVPLQEEKIVYQRPMLPTEMEKSKTNLKTLLEQVAIKNVNGDTSEKNREEITKYIARRHRKPKEECLIPTNLCNRIPVGENGCFTVEFSPDGEYLAAACADDVMFPVHIYEVATGKLVYSLEGHVSIVYEINWKICNRASRDDETFLEIATASGDGTVRIWSIPRQGKISREDQANSSDDDEYENDSEDELDSIKKSKKSRKRDKKKKQRKRRSKVKSNSNGAQVLQVLQHNPPTYIYTVQYHPTAEEPTVLITGSYDHSVRLWTNEGALLGKLDRGRAHHKSRVNTATFSADGNRLFTGDGEGVVNVWRLETGRRPSNPNAWHLARRIDDQDLRGNPINSISIHPKEKLLLVSAHKHVIRLFELRRYSRVHNGYIGAPIAKSNIKCVFSADGSYVVSGGEDGKPHFWNTMTTLGVPGKNWELGYGKPLCDVAWHPNQHLVAFCSFGANYPILMYEALRQLRSTAAFMSDDEGAQEELLALESKRLREENIKKFQNDRANKILDRLKSMDVDEKTPPKRHRLSTLDKLDLITSENSSVNESGSEGELEEKEDEQSEEESN